MPTGVYPRPSLAERFWRRVDRRGPDECWPWLGAHNSWGYGQIRIGARTRPAQVVACELTSGQPFPEGMDGCHTCDNPPCCNPAHVFPGTARDNMQDAAHKGRLRFWNAGKTICIRGHQLSGGNLIVCRSGARRCRACFNDGQRRRRAGYRAAAA